MNYDYTKLTEVIQDIYEICKDKEGFNLSNFIDNFSQFENYDISDLLDIVKILRSPGGCPWDAEQNHKSVRNDLLEEAYEVCDAIDTADNDALKEELGDLLLQVVFHSDIAKQEDGFDSSVGLGVSTGSCGTLTNLESAEAYELNLVALLKSLSNSFDKSSNCLISVFLAKTSFFCDSSNEFCFVHS